MRCPKCGQSNADWAVSCKLCGERLPQPYQYGHGPGTALPDDKVERATFWLLVIVIILIVVVIIAGILFWSLVMDDMGNLSDLQAAMSCRSA